jgi:hypothetical protein
MMKKYTYIIVILLCIVPYVHTQNVKKEEFILDAAYRYIPIDQSLDDILDTLMVSSQNCIFNALGRDYFFDFYFYEDNRICAQIYPYESYWGIHLSGLENYRDTKKAKKGFLYYKEKLVLITFSGKRWSQYDINQIFSPYRHLEVITYSIPAEPLPEVGKGLDVITLDGVYDPDSETFSVTKILGCTGEKYYSYMVQGTDTWKKIAEKFGTTEENIRTIKNEYNPDQCLVPGSTIEVHYEIVDGVLQVTRTR